MYKKLLLTIALILPLIGLMPLSGYAQTYSPSAHTVVSKPLGLNGQPSDARSYYYDATHFIYRPYQSTAEVLTYLNTTKSRTGNFVIIVNSGGTINSTTGLLTGGTNSEYWFKDGTADANLVAKVTGGGPSNTFSSPLSVDGAGNVTIQQASDLQAGYLSAADHATFNGKQNAIGYTPENQANKVQSVDNSTTNYPSNAAVTAALAGKYNTPVGNTSQYVRGDGSLQAFPVIPSIPTVVSAFINDINYVTLTVGDGRYGSLSQQTANNNAIGANYTSLGKKADRILPADPGATSTAIAANDSLVMAAYKLQKQISTNSTKLVSTNVIYLSKIGCVSDADLKMYTSTFGTNNTSLIQAVLNTATKQTPLLVYVDGSYCVDSLRIKGFTRIIGAVQGAGFVQRPGVACKMIGNYNRTLGAIVDSNIVVENVILNGAGYDVNGNPLRAGNGINGGWNAVYDFRGVYNLRVENCTLYNSRTIIGFCSNFSNVRFINVRVRQSSVYPTNDYLRHDGPKFLGPGNNLLIEGLDCYSVDDVMSLVANDVWQPTNTSAMESTNYTSYDPYATYGDLTNVRVNGLLMRGGFHGIRLLSQSNKLDNIFFQNIMGTVQDFVCTVDNLNSSGLVYIPANGSRTGTVGNISFKDVSVSLTQNGTWSAYAACGFYVSTNVNKITLDNISYSGYSSTYPFVKVDVNGYVTNLFGSNVTIAELTDPSLGFSISGSAPNKRGEVFTASTAAVVYKMKSTFTAPDNTPLNGSTSGSYTPDLGNKWTDIYGTFTIVSNRATTTGTGTSNEWVTSNDIGTSSYTLNVTGKKNANNDILQVFFNYTDPNNTYVINYGSGGGANNLYLYNIVGGTTTLLSTLSIQPGIGNDHNIQVIVNGTSAQISVDGGAATAVTLPTAVSSTKIAVGAANISTAGMLSDVSFKSVTAQ